MAWNITCLSCRGHPPIARLPPIAPLSWEMGERSVRASACCPERCPYTGISATSTVLVTWPTPGIVRKMATYTARLISLAMIYSGWVASPQYGDPSGPSIRYPWHGTSPRRRPPYLTPRQRMAKLQRASLTRFGRICRKY